MRPTAVVRPGYQNFYVYSAVSPLTGEEVSLQGWLQLKTGKGNTIFDTSGVEPALNLTMSGDITWVGGWGVNSKPTGKAQGTATNSKKLADLIKSTGEFSMEVWLVNGNVAQEDAKASSTITLGFAAAIGQILLLDIVFSIDSIITAVGMTEHLPIMIIAVISAVVVMMVAADPLARFINDNPTVVMLALGFLIMIGMTLIAEGFGVHVPKGYVYAAMAFSTAIEVLNILSRRARTKREEISA